MIAAKTINICGKQVEMRYCIAAETGYEVLSGQSAEVFNPSVRERDAEGKPTKFDAPKATTSDYIKLACAAIVAAYERNGQEAPIKAEEILYDATPEEITALVTAIVELRLQWYNIPGVIKPETDEKPDDSKNA